MGASRGGRELFADRVVDVRGGARARAGTGERDVGGFLSSVVAHDFVWTGGSVRRDDVFRDSSRETVL